MKNHVDNFLTLFHLEKWKNNNIYNIERGMTRKATNLSNKKHRKCG